MTIPRHHSSKTEMAQYILLGLPTIALMAFGIYLANQWLEVLSNQWMLQSIFFASGIFSSIFCFARRLRFITLTSLFIISFFVIHQLAARLLAGEFENFFFTIGFTNYFVLFTSGWIAGYGFSRSRFMTMVWAITLMSVLVFVIANISKPTQSSIVLSSVPVLVYVVYIIYIAELLRNINENQTRFGFFITRRILTFGLLLALIMLSALNLLNPEFNTIEKEWEQGGKPKQENEKQGSLTRNDGMGKSTQSSMGLQGFNNRANKDSVLFVAKLDNYFPDSDVPNPLYFVSDYFTRFDTITQTFETDTLRPYDDLFRPDLLSIPLYYTKEDSSVLERSMGNLNLKEATAEVYKTGLSPRHFTAPSTAFFVQPISVPSENKDYYKSAYRVKMMVSDLNSAYFVYNPAGDFGLELFQEQRFTALRMIEDYAEAPADFMAYYTRMPQGVGYDSIRTLAARIADTVGSSPVEKVIAIRNFFTAMDSSGNPTFRYSDNPGIPGIPGANRLSHFLFESKKGYCAYYAGATLFLLRALGIPSRIATGFLTVDRSNKNPGWYWFYEDQAHAWVQVWFPGYGWLDFDTTVPSTETQEAPQPDQTPPLTSQTAWLVANGSVLTADSAKARVRMNVSDALFKDMPFAPATPQPFDLDISLAKIIKDTGMVTTALLKPGLKIVAVSFSDLFKEIPLERKETWDNLVKKWPTPLPIDEIKIIDPVKEPVSPTAASQKLEIPWTKIAIALMISLMVLGFMSLLFPITIFSWFVYKAKNNRDLNTRAYGSYMASMLYLHQLGKKRNSLTPLQFAENQIDPFFGTQLASFIKTYEKLKYSQKGLNDEELNFINHHLPVFLDAVRKKIPPGKRFISFLKINNTVEFFTRPNILGSTKSMEIWNKI